MAWFDHILVRAVVDGRTYWLDGTRVEDRDLSTIRPPSFDWALPVRDRAPSSKRSSCRPPTCP